MAEALRISENTNRDIIVLQCLKLQEIFTTNSVTVACVRCGAKHKAQSILEQKSSKLCMCKLPERTPRRLQKILNLILLPVHLKLSEY